MNLPLKIYIAGPITGMTGEEVINYFNDTAEKLEQLGYGVLHPMTAKGYFRTEKKFKAEGYTFPQSTNRAIVGRDHWMVSQCDILWLNLLNAKAVTIGGVSELAWAYHMRKHTLVTMSIDDPENVHNHGFVREMADIIYPTYAELYEYLTNLSVMRA
jgi:nucleoside 2-deoxyribosyltransferase